MTSCSSVQNHISHRIPIQKFIIRHIQGDSFLFYLNVAFLSASIFCFIWIRFGSTNHQFFNLILSPQFIFPLPQPTPQTRSLQACVSPEICAQDLCLSNQDSDKQQQAEYNLAHIYAERHSGQGSRFPEMIWRCECRPLCQFTVMGLPQAVRWVLGMLDCMYTMLKPFAGDNQLTQNRTCVRGVTLAQLPTRPQQNEHLQTHTCIPEKKTGKE